jgi:WD40 repeat protein
MHEISQLHLIDPRSGYITNPRWSPDGRSLAIPTQCGSIVIFDLDSGAIVRTLGFHAGEVTTVGWDHQAELLMSGSLDRSIGLWDPKTGKRAPFVVDGHQEAVHSTEWTDEGAFAVTCSSDRVRALDGCCLLAGWTPEMESAANTYTGFTAAACSHRTTFLLALVAESASRLVLVSLLSGSLLDNIQMEQPIRSLAWSPAEDLLAAGVGDSIVVLRATQEGFESPSSQLASQTPRIYALAYSGDGSFLASCDAQGIKIWSVEEESLIAAFAEDFRALSHSSRPPGIAFHPTMPLVAAVDATGTALRILDVSKVV